MLGEFSLFSFCVIRYRNDLSSCCSEARRIDHGIAKLLIRRGHITLWLGYFSLLAFCFLREVMTLLVMVMNIRAVRVVFSRFVGGGLPNVFLKVSGLMIVD